MLIDLTPLVKPGVSLFLFKKNKDLVDNSTGSCNSLTWSGLSVQRLLRNKNRGCGMAALPVMFPLQNLEASRATPQLLAIMF